MSRTDKAYWVGWFAGVFSTLFGMGVAYLIAHAV